MKSVLGIVSCFFIGYILPSCCKAYCDDQDIFALDLYGFTAPEIEKIKVLRFNRGDFNSTLDSFSVTTNNLVVRDTTRVYLDTPLDSDFDFTIKIENAGRNYSITDFQTKKENCSCTSGTYQKITGYKLNGSQISANDIYTLEIRK
jgi:hypothetical protein